MKYLLRKFLSLILPIVIVLLAAHGLLCGFTEMHIYGIAISAAVLFLIWCGKVIRRIIYFPFRLIRKVLFKF